MFERPSSPACQRNKEPIYLVLKNYITKGDLLEIGSLTAEHAEFIAPKFKELNWHLSEHHLNLELLKQIHGLLNIKNIIAPIKLTIGEDSFPDYNYQYVFTANTLHIMNDLEVKLLLDLFCKNLNKGSYLFIYGPFKYKGEYTSESNAQFDQSLKLRGSSIKEFEDIQSQLSLGGFTLINDHAMPANNQLLVYKRKL